MWLGRRATRHGRVEEAPQVLDGSARAGSALILAASRRVAAGRSFLHLEEVDPAGGGGRPGWQQ